MINFERLVLLILFHVIRSSVANEELIVTLPEGQIRGHTLKSANDNVFYAFQEIPYAAPPVGDLRFHPPVAPEKWDGILNTTKNKKMCYQSGIFFDSKDLIETEDCLYLNVYTPLISKNSQTSLPVLIFIHGGAYINGAGAFQVYKPGLFIDYNIVVVTINYRLGPLGFLTTEDEVIPGNLGLKDQYFAMQWVKQNINLFGGDPEKITVSGESAGAASVGLHIISQKSKNLFRAAILQSGTPLCQWSHQKYARFYAFKLGQSLNANFTSDDSSELLNLLKSASASDINNNTIVAEVGKETAIILNGSYIWLPVIEDANLEGSYITDFFHEDLQIGNINKVPILIGFNSEERLFVMKDDPSLPEKYAKYFDSDLSHLIGTKFNMTEENKLVAGTKLRQIYTNGTFLNNLGTVVKFNSDQAFSTPIVRHAQLQSNYTDVYLYQFSYKGEMGGMMTVEVAGVRGVAHAEELGYLWDVRIPSDEHPTEVQEDLVTRHRLLTMWSNFVKYLNPTPKKDSNLDNVTWEKLTPNNLLYLDINITLQIQTNPKEYIEWQKIIDLYAIPPLVNY